MPIFSLTAPQPLLSSAPQPRTQHPHTSFIFPHLLTFCFPLLFHHHFLPICLTRCPHSLARHHALASKWGRVSPLFQSCQLLNSHCSLQVLFITLSLEMHSFQPGRDLLHLLFLSLGISCAGSSAISLWCLYAHGREICTSAVSCVIS